MIILVYLLVLVISFFFWYQKKYGKRNKLLSKFASPPRSFPIMNNSLYFIGKSPQEIFKIISRFHKILPPVWRFDLNPFMSFINVRDPKVVEEILSSQKLIDKANEYNLLKIWLGTGLIMSTGKKWHQRRKIITPSFHFKILEEFVNVMEKHGKIFIDKLKRYNGQKIDIFSSISLYTLDVICESAMGYELRAQGDETSEYVKAVKEISSILFKKVLDLKKRIHFIYQFTSDYKREKELLKILHGFTLSVINARRREKLKNMDKLSKNIDDFGIKRKTAFLDLMLEAKIDGELLDDESIREEVDNFMFAGHDTTSSAITFTLLNLAMNPEAQQHVFEECHEVLGNDLHQLHSMQDLNKLSYLEKVIKESLRLYPPVSSYSRNFREDVKLGDYIFPANVSTKINMYAMGRDEALFPNPNKFDPSRFDDETKDIKLFSYVPFSAGPRNCIGQKFAMLELKSIVSKIIMNFFILIEKDDENPVIAQEIVLRPINGAFLRFKTRSILK